MNDELQKALAALLGKTVNAVETGVSFLQAELPEVIRQLLLWHMCKSTVLCAMFFAVAVYLMVHLKAWFEELDVIVIFPALAAFFTAGFAVTFGLEALQIYLAPKVYLIEYAAKLASK